MTKKEILLKNEKIEYQIRESVRARCLRITIYPSGDLAATLPRGFSVENLEDFLHQKADWILRKMRRVQKRKPSLVLPRASRREYLAKKNEAFMLVKEKILQFGAIYNLYPAKICIRNQKTRWGSCSRKGNLNFSYRVVYLPEKYLNYIIVHELCHLREFNHSKKFWNLVGEVIPDYKKIRKEIRNL